MNSMKKTTPFLSLALAVTLLSGCESARKAFSGDKNAPDEFAVYSRPPLSLPPDYRLRPPPPGTFPPQALSAKSPPTHTTSHNPFRHARLAHPLKGTTVLMSF